jgi:hypothetical protein
MPIEFYQRTLTERVNNFTKNLSLVNTGVLVEIRTAHLPNTVRFIVLAVYTGGLTNNVIL